MAGFLKGLFSSNNDSAAPKAPKAPKPVEPPMSKDAFFLSADDAKSLGDINYMRSSKTIKRTFAKKKGQEHLESIKTVSAMKMAEVSDTEMMQPKKAWSQSTTAPTFEAAKAPVAKKAQPAESTQSAAQPATDTGMDMFRSMARNIRR